jgi:UDP-GlcNAc:undecaprenyl-phosphate GlcNAc-1-phosphate transferase
MLAAGLVALIGSSTTVALTTRLGPRLGAMDRPKALSIHSTPTPRTGGLGVVAGVAVAVGWSLVALPGLTAEDKATLVGLLGAGLLVALIGLLDDVGRIPTSVEVSALLIPAALVVLLGLKVDSVPVAVVSVPVTLFYIVGGCSAMNLVDGMNGLAGGVAAIAASFFGLLCFTRGDVLGTVLSLSVLGAVVGFLPFNFPRASVFLGDNGSLFLGYVLAVLAVRSSVEPYQFSSWAAPILFLGVPVGDTFLAILRRLLNRGQVLSGDRRHVYDLLRERVGDVSAVVTMWGIAAMGGVAGLLASHVDALPALAILVVWFSVVFCLAIWLGAARTHPAAVRHSTERARDASSPLGP